MGEREVFHCNLPGRPVTGTPIDKPTKARARRVAEKTVPKTDELFSDKKRKKRPYRTPTTRRSTRVGVCFFIAYGLAFFRFTVPESTSIPMVVKQTIAIEISKIRDHV